LTLAAALGDDVEKRAHLNVDVVLLGGNAAAAARWPSTAGGLIQRKRASGM
jgi:hypothetical protein